MTTLAMVKKLVMKALFGLAQVPIAHFQETQLNLRVRILNIGLSMYQESDLALMMIGIWNQLLVSLTQQ
jgi:hypothetical protein